MGAQCAKAIVESNTKCKHHDYLSKKGPSDPEGRSSARFLAPETRRAGSPISLFPTEYDWPDSPLQNFPKEVSKDRKEEIYYSKDSSTVHWNCAKIAKLIRKLQMSPSSFKAYGEGLNSNVIYSPQFSIPSAGSRLKWRLVWAICDHNEYSASLYLQCCNPHQKMPLFEPLHAKFSMGIVRPKNMIRSCPSKIDMNLSHCFSREESSWGIQECLSAEEAAEYVNEDTQSIQAFLTLVLVSSVPPSVSLQTASQASTTHVELISEEPRIILFDNFLNFAECKALIELAEPELQRSRVATGTETPSRTSYGTFLTGRKETDPIVVKVEEKIASCLKENHVLRDGPKMRKPLIKSEALQVVRYRVGQFYNEHYDNKAGNASHRAATFMIYLSDVDAGGATYFSRSSGRPAAGSKGLGEAGDYSKPGFWGSGSSKNPPGLRIYPKLGRAILFWSRLSNGNEDMSSIHAAESVIAGEKWILTRWMREIE